MTLFTTKTKREDAISAFMSLIQHPGWKLLEQIWDENIKVLREELEEGFEGEKRSDVDRVRDKLKQLKEIRNTPEKLIKDFGESKDEEVSLDPYYTPEQLAAERKKVNP